MNNGMHSQYVPFYKLDKFQHIHVRLPRRPKSHQWHRTVDSVLESSIRKVPIFDLTE